ncbi:MAG: DUF465 domain-containing protein [Thermodesulfobacteriota bacterium]|nr:DUF465 domain-containing protein [Thermodesulfobacteriota bacterium]
MSVSQDEMCGLCENDPRFRRLYEEHQLLEQQLQRLDQCSFLTSEQELQRKKIQKLKLSSKDEMNQLISVS